MALTPEAVGLRPEDMPYAPRPEHFAAANKRLHAITRAVEGRLAELGNTADAKPDDRLLAMAMVEREIDRARRAFGMFFEVFAQRGTAFARRLPRMTRSRSTATTRSARAAPHSSAARLFRRSPIWSTAIRRPLCAAASR